MRGQLISDCKLATIDAAFSALYPNVNKRALQWT
ncbi:hypothetical protein MCEMSEM23_00865 [Rhabdaerophilaceae bacterium]